MLFIVVKYTVYAKTAFLKYNSIKPVIRDFGFYCTFWMAFSNDVAFQIEILKYIFY